MISERLRIFFSKIAYEIRFRRALKGESYQPHKLRIQKGSAGDSLLSATIDETTTGMSALRNLINQQSLLQ